MQECRPEFSAPRAAAVHTVPDNVQPPLLPPPRQRKNREREREDLCRGKGAATRRLRKPIRYKVNIALIVLITK